MVRHEILAPPVPAAFSAMTFPAYRHLLALQPAQRHPGDPHRPPVVPLAIAAWVADNPVGLALGEMPTSTSFEPELLSLFVTPHLRRVGIGTGLVGAFESELARRGFGRVGAVYMTGKDGTVAFERIVEKCGWAKPGARTIVIRLAVSDIDRLPWLNRYRLPAGFEIFPWAELRPDERETLRSSQASRGWIAPDLQPWDHDAYGFEPTTSLGLRCADGVVGWVINHAISETTLRFTCSYIRKDLGRRGRILPLYSASLARMKESPFLDCTFVAPVQHPTMVRFVQRWVSQWASFVGETRGTFKVLSPPAERRPEHGAGRPARGSGPEPEDGDARARRESSEPASQKPQR